MTMKYYIYLNVMNLSSINSPHHPSNKAGVVVFVEYNECLQDRIRSLSPYS